MVAASLHASSMDQVGTTTGDDVAAAHIHGNAHHAMRRYSTAGRGHYRSDMSSTSLCVKVGPSTALSVQLSLRVVGVSCTAGDQTL